MKIRITFSGMTLTELLVVLAILGILLLLSFPVLKPIFARTHAIEAKTNLRHLAKLEDTYFMQRFSFSDHFQALGYEHAKLVSQEDGTAHYRIEIVKADRENYLARATAITDFDGDGAFNTWEIDKSGIPRELVPD